MQNVNLHKQKLYALIIAAVALISLLLPWMSVSYNFGGFGGGGSRSVNGFRGWGYLSFIGIIAVVVSALLEDKTKEYQGNPKMIAMGAFGLIAIGAIVFMLRVNAVGGAGFQGVKSSPGFGLFIALAAGIAGIAWVAGLIKLPDTPSHPTSSAPPPPPPQ
ncbi:MAG: hypothetical protein JJE22_09720 [Bacteroidia bacterium]|nr:hypothetical protein [Bacteroidia bacterium]